MNEQRKRSEIYMIFECGNKEKNSVWHGLRLDKGGDLDGPGLHTSFWIVEK